jgi:hypothetical protein
MSIDLTPPESSTRFPGANTMRVLFKGNIMDLGLTAGEASVALRQDFRAETLGTAMADKFLKNVQRAFRYFAPDSYPEHHRYLTDAEALLELLSLEKAVAVSAEAQEAVEVFRRRVEDGRKISDKVPLHERFALSSRIPEERS